MEKTAVSRGLTELLCMSADDKLELVLRGIEDTGKSSEYGLLLGSNPIEAESRCAWAARLYSARRVKYIIASGGVYHEYKGRSMKECDFMAEMLVENGVPADAIILEDGAQTTKENMILGGLVLNRKTKLVDVDEILIISSAWHMKRSLAIAKCFLPRKITPFGGPAPFPADKELWLSDAAHIKMLDNEIRFMKRLEDNGMAEINSLLD